MSCNNFLNKIWMILENIFKTWNENRLDEWFDQHFCNLLFRPVFFILFNFYSSFYICFLRNYSLLQLKNYTIYWYYESCGFIRLNYKIITSIFTTFISKRLFDCHSSSLISALLHIQASCYFHFIVLLPIFAFLLS